MSVQYVERLAHVVPIGIRLRDSVTGLQITDGLSVRFILVGEQRWRSAFRTSSGVFAVHGLPGLRTWEEREVGPDGAPADVLLPPRLYRIEVRDSTGRFHSFAFEADLPNGGLAASPCGSPPASPPAEKERDLPLFSVPSRTAPAGHAVVRAQLVRDDDLQPAAYAALEVIPKPGAEPVRGIADERGQVVVIFPYPLPTGVVGSPPAGAKKPLSKASWTVTLQAYVPQPASPPQQPALPDLCTFLDQSPATLVTTASPSTELGAATLEYGRELVLRSSPDDAALLVRT
jgi:hypothetical protein